MILKPLLAQTPTLSKRIKIIDFVSRKALPGAHVITSTNKAITDSQGYVTVEVANATDTVSISYMGYDTEKVPFNTLSESIELVTAVNGLDEVLLTGKKKKNIWPWVGAAVVAGFLLLPGDKKTLKI